MLSALLQLNYMLFQEINAPAGSNPWFDALMIFCANSLIFCWPLLLLIVWGRPLTWRKQALQSDEAAFVAERRATVLWVVVACIVAYGLNLLIEQSRYTFLLRTLLMLRFPAITPPGHLPCWVCSYLLLLPRFVLRGVNGA